MWSNVWPNGNRARMEKENLKKRKDHITNLSLYEPNLGADGDNGTQLPHSLNPFPSNQPELLQNLLRRFVQSKCFVEYCLHTSSHAFEPQDAWVGQTSWKIAFEEIGQVKMGPLWYIIETRMPVLRWALKRIRHLTTSVNPMSRMTFPESLVEVQAPEWWLRRGFT